MQGWEQKGAQVAFFKTSSKSTLQINGLLPLTPSAMKTCIEHEGQHHNAGMGSRTDHWRDLCQAVKFSVPRPQ